MTVSISISKFYYLPIIAQICDPAIIVEANSFLNDIFARGKLYNSYYAKHLSYLREEYDTICDSIALLSDKSAFSSETDKRLLESSESNRKLNLAALARDEEIIKRLQTRAQNNRSFSNRFLEEAKFSSKCFLASHIITVAIAISLFVIGFGVNPFGLIPIIAVGSLCLIGRIIVLYKCHHIQTVSNPTFIRA